MKQKIVTTSAEVRQAQQQQAEADKAYSKELHRVISANPDMRRYLARDMGDAKLIDALEYLQVADAVLALLTENHNA